MQNLNFKLIMIVINKGTFYMQIVKENYVRKQHIFEETCLTKLKLLEVSLSCRGVTMHFFHKRYVSQYLICFTIRFIGNCNYSLKSILVDMFFFIYEVAYVLAEIKNI